MPAFVISGIAYSNTGQDHQPYGDLVAGDDEANVLELFQELFKADPDWETYTLGTNFDIRPVHSDNMSDVLSEITPAPVYDLDESVIPFAKSGR